MRELTTTSYAVLALLAVRPHTTYELAKQMERSLRDVWPRAESVIYEEPKRLAAHGYATASVSHVGRRARTTYVVTSKGRRALRRWLCEPGAGPTMEFEALLKVAFGDLGDLDGLRTNIAAIAELAEARSEYVEQRLTEYRETGGPFPERLPVIGLAARFQQEQARMLRRWAAWAEREIAAWEGVTPATGAVAPPLVRRGA